MLLEPLLGEFLVLPAPSLPSLYFFAPFNHTAPAVFQEPDAPKQIQKPTALSRESSQRIFFKRRLSKTKHMNKFVSRSAKRGHLFLNDTFFSLGIGDWLNQKSDVFLLKLIIVDSIDITNLFYWYWICRNYWFQCMCFLLIFLLLLIWSLGDAFWLQIMWRVELSCLAKACVKRVPVPLRRGLTAWILTKEVLHTHPSLKLTQLCLWHVF